MGFTLGPHATAQPPRARQPGQRAGPDAGHGGVLATALQVNSCTCGPDRPLGVSAAPPKGKTSSLGSGPAPGRAAGLTLAAQRTPCA